MGGGNTTTQTQTSAPWSGVQPQLTQAYGAAQNLYNTGKGFDYYPNSTVVPFSSQTQAAMTGTENLANQGDPLAQTSAQNAQDVLSSGGLSDWQKQGLQGAYGVATGANPLSTTGYQGLLANGATSNVAQQNLGDSANGALLGTTTPAFDAALQHQSDLLSGDISRNYSNMGRYGSAAMTGELGDQIGNLRNNALQQNYDAERQNQLAAVGQISNENQQNFSNQSGLLSQINSTQNQNTQNTLAGGNLVNNAGNAAGALALGYSQAAPDIYSSQYAPYQQLAQVGAQNESMSTQTLQDQINRYNSGQQQPYNQLNAYLASLSGSGQLGGQTTATATQPTNYLAPLGGALQGAQIGSSIFGAGGAGYGALGGGLLGLLGM